MSASWAVDHVLVPERRQRLRSDRRAPSCLRARAARRGQVAPVCRRSWKRKPLMPTSSVAGSQTRRRKLLRRMGSPSVLGKMSPSCLRRGRPRRCRLPTRPRRQSAVSTRMRTGRWNGAVRCSSGPFERQARGVLEDLVVRDQRNTEAYCGGGDPAVGVVLALAQGVSVRAISASMRRSRASSPQPRRSAP
jgi:hypothetical protein